MFFKNRKTQPYSGYLGVGLKDPKIIHESGTLGLRQCDEMGIYLEKPVCPFWSLIFVQGLYFPNFGHRNEKNIRNSTSVHQVSSSKNYDHFQASGCLYPEYFLDFPSEFCRNG